MIAYVLVKKEFETKFMQSADVFEKFKFVGEILEIQVEFNKTIPETYAAMRDGNTEQFSVVGLIVPNQIAIVAANHRVMSDGKVWVMVEDLAKMHGLNHVSWVPHASH